MGVSTILPAASRRQRTLAQAIVAAVVVVNSYGLSIALHRRAIAEVEAARKMMARADWLGAIDHLDRARRLDPFLSDHDLLRARAIIEHLGAVWITERRHTWDEALADLDRYLADHPDSGEAYKLRGMALLALGKVKPAGAALDRAIALLPDPTEALVVRAGLSFHDQDYARAEREIGGAIDRHPRVPEYYDERAFYRRTRGDLAGAQADRVRAQLLRESKGITVEQLEKQAKARLDRRPIEASQESPAVEAERARILGRWDVVVRETEGEAEPSRTPDYFFRFETGRYRLVRSGAEVQEGEYWLDAGRIDCVVGLNGQRQRLLGRYEIRGETMRIVLASPGEARPYDFRTRPADTSVAYTLRRAGSSDRGKIRR